MLWGTEIFNGAEQIRKPLISCTIQFIYRCKWKRKCRHNLLLRKSLRRSAIDQESVLEKAQIEDILRFHVKYGMLFLGSCGLDHVATLLRNFRRSFSFPRNKHIFFCLPAAISPNKITHCFLSKHSAEGRSSKLKWLAITRGSLLYDKIKSANWCLNLFFNFRNWKRKAGALFNSQIICKMQFKKQSGT